MPAVSKKQQKFMGMVHAVQKGDISPPSKAVSEAAKSIKPGDAKDFASTPRKGLPEKKAEKKAYVHGFLSRCIAGGFSDVQIGELVKRACADPEVKKVFDEGLE